MKKNKLTNSYLGGQLKTKAFTLIELLAIIVILAIIAVITVPIILNVIDNAKRGSIIDSAYGYKDAIDKYYITKLMEEDFELDDTYSVSDGKLGGIDIPISGMKPISGTLTYEDNELKSGCLTFDDYSVTYDGSKFTNEKGICPTGRAITYTDSNGVKYYNTEWIEANPVYYDPANGTKCDNYHEDNSKTGYNGLNPTDNQTSCLKWYAYNEQNGQVNLLLDHNTTANAYWNKNGINSEGPGNKSKEQLGNSAYNEVLYALQQDTNIWSNELGKLENYKPSSGNFNWTIDYNGYKARLITAEELANITGQEGWTLSGNFFYLDTNCKTSGTCMQGQNKYWWLFSNLGANNSTDSCINYGCKEGLASDPYGYWTASPYTNDSQSAWRLNGLNDLNHNITSYGTNAGVRPVITVSKSSIFES